MTYSSFYFSVGKCSRSAKGQLVSRIVVPRGVGEEGVWRRRRGGASCGEHTQGRRYTASRVVDAAIWVARVDVRCAPPTPYKAGTVCRGPLSIVFCGVGTRSTCDCGRDVRYLGFCAPVCVSFVRHVRAEHDLCHVFAFLSRCCRLLCV